MKINISIVLALILFLNVNSFAQEPDPLLEKLVAAAGEKTYLKDYPYQLDPGDQTQFHITLEKNIIYDWYTYLKKSNQAVISLFDKYGKQISQSNFNSKGIVNFTTYSFESEKYILTIKNVSNRPLSSIIVLMYTRKFNPNKEKTPSFIANKLNVASKGTYLKEFVIGLLPDEVSRVSLVLSKNTKYEFSYYEQEPNQIQFILYDNEKEIKSAAESIKHSSDANSNNLQQSGDIKQIDYNISNTRVYHSFIKNISDKPIKTVVLLSFLERGVYDEEEIIQITSYNKTQEQAEQESIQEEEIFFVVEDMPSFNGASNNEKSLDEFRKFTDEQLRYPQEAIHNQIEGKVFVQFIVSKTGYIRDAKVIRGVDPSLNQEALRVIYCSPKWKPGKQRGRVVDVMFTVPIEFKLKN